MSRIARASAPAFTLLEVMIAVAFIGIALLALLSLQHSDMVSVIRAGDITKASMLAQSLMSEAEIQRFPDQGTTNGDFHNIYPGLYPNFKWQRLVDQSPIFPDVRRVRIYVFYGPSFSRRFELTEFMHNPVPQVNAENAPPDQGQEGAGNSPNVGLGGPGNAAP